MSRRPNRRQAVIGMGLLLFAGSFLAIRWLQQPAFGTLSSRRVDGTDVKGSSNVQENLETNLFSTRVSSGFKMKSKNEVPSPSTLGQYLLADKDVYAGDQLAITVGIVKENDVNEVSPVQFRRTMSDEYSEVAAEAGFPDGSVSFVKQKDFEKSVFWVHDGQYAAVVVSGGIQNQASLEDSLHTVVVNWRWK